jgi:hypothetical protein
MWSIKNVLVLVLTGQKPIVEPFYTLAILVVSAPTSTVMGRITRFRVPDL